MLAEREKEIATGDDLKNDPAQINQSNPTMPSYRSLTNLHVTITKDFTKKKQQLMHVGSRSRTTFPVISLHTPSLIVANDDWSSDIQGAATPAKT